MFNGNNIKVHYTHQKALKRLIGVGVTWFIAYQVTKHYVLWAGGTWADPNKSLVDYLIALPPILLTALANLAIPIIRSYFTKRSSDK